MKTLENYTETAHKQFTNETVNVNGKIFIIYKNKGYSGKSTVYGSIFNVTQGKDINLKFKTKKQVVKYLISQK